jgi:hypothetical protein
MLKDLFDDIWLVNKRNDPHFSLALGAGQRICFVDLSDEVGPAFFHFFGYRWRGDLDRLPSDLGGFSAESLCKPDPKLVVS